jgi:hypothetical protein
MYAFQLVWYNIEYLSFEIEQKLRHVFEQTSAIRGHGRDESFVEMEKADVDAPKDTTNEGGEVGFSNDFAFLDVFESEDVWVKERLIRLLRVQLLLCCVKEMQEGDIVVTNWGCR